MATNRDPQLDPERIAAREFGTSFRGYDTHEVRRFLQQVAEVARADSAHKADDPEAIRALVDERDELRRRVAQLERAANSAENDDAIHVTSLITSETTQVIESARAAAAEIIRKAETEASRRRKEVKELEQRVDAEIQQKRSAVAEDTARVRRETQSEVNKLRNEADEETKSLRAKADEYAATTRAQAQEILRSRTAEAESFYETRTRKTEEATAAMRAEAEEETATMRRNAEDAAAKMRREAEEETLALRRRTDEEVKALRASTEAEAEDLRTAAQARVDELNVEADKIKAESENAANIARAEAAAAADLATREVRDEARLMVAEARAVREKILTDLVRRRRAARQQIDQARAARDRLLRSLDAQKRELDEATAELQRAVPEARAAMERVPTPVSDDDAEVRAALSALDKARPERMRSFTELGEEPETEGYARRLAGQEPVHRPEPEPDPDPEPVEVSDDEAEPSADSSDTDQERASDESDAEANDGAGSVPPPPMIEDAIGGPAPSPEGPTESDPTQQGDPVVADDEGPVDIEAGGAVDPTLERSDRSRTADHDRAGRNETDESSDSEDARIGLFSTALGEDEDQQVPRSAGLFGLGSAPAPAGVEPLFGKGSAESDDQSEDESETADTEDKPADSQHLVEKAEALDRLAPDLKRHLKRALADDQNDFLDAVRRGGKHASVQDLPAEDRQVARFADALETALRASANAGASAVGGRIWPGLADGLVADTAHRLVDDVRSVVTAAVRANGGEDAALEAIRSHYRNVRQNRLNRLVDDSLSSAFALGVEHGADAG
ncbi:MAG: DivIVA domain-containing protein [Acidimicrobiales bacterium]